MTYHTEAPKPTDKCDICGEPATIVWVADWCESDTGYVESEALCEKHASESKTELL